VVSTSTPAAPWAEVSAESVGMDSSLVAAAVRCAADRLARHGAAGQLVVLRRGRVVLDRAFGTDPTDLLLTFSVSKPYLALLVHRLAERGLLSLDEPVAARWPAFGRHGKEVITPRMVLTHRAGVPDDRPVAALAGAASWAEAVRRMERLVPPYPPGEVTAYHALTFGWILGELVRRATGRPVERALRDELLEPLGLRDTFLGLPDEQRRRAVPLVAAGRRNEVATAVVFNRRRSRRAVAPAATVSATARDVARFFEMARRGGELDGVRVLGRGAVAEALRASTPGPVLDRRVGVPVRTAHGLYLGGVTTPTDLARRFGTLSAREAFGHTGASSCTAWADPVRELVLVYLTGLLLPSPAAGRHQSLVSDCVIRACG
jgi:CubicO group peptidase (beta-lactamase class C family)